MIRKKFGKSKHTISNYRHEMRKYDEIAEGIIRYGVEIDTDAVKKQEILAAIESDDTTLTSIADVSSVRCGI